MINLTNTNRYLPDSFEVAESDYVIAINVRNIMSKPCVACTRLNTRNTVLERNQLDPTVKSFKVPLTANQYDLWLDCQLTPDIAKYNIGGYITIEESWDEKQLNEVFKTLILRHDVLRLEIIEDQDKPQQNILPNINFNLPILSFHDSQNPEADARIWMKKDMQRPFDLSQAPLWRFAILRLSENKYCWYYAFHHLICDGVSVHLIASSFAEIYNARINGKTIPTSPNFRDAVTTDAEYINSSRYVKDAYFWEAEYQTLPDSIFPIKNDKQHQGATLRLDLSQSRADSLNALTSTGSPFQAVIALIYLYFSRVSNISDLSIGVATHNRRGAIERNTLGFFSQVLALRLDMPSDIHFSESIDLISKKLKAYYKHTQFPQGEVNRRLRKLLAGRNRPFDVELSFIPSDYGEMAFAKTSSPFMFIPNEQEQVPLRIYCFHDLKNGIFRFYFNHNLRYISSLEASQIVERFDHLIHQVTSNQHQRLRDFSLTPASELEHILAFNQGISTPVPEIGLDKPACIHQLFEEQVAKTPNRIAVVFEDQQLTYRELNEKANQLAHYLINEVKLLKQEPTETLVALCLERSLNMQIALFGILKAGMAYVPLAPTQPAKRLSYMLNDCAAPLLLTDSSLSDELPPCQAKVTPLDTAWQLIAAHSNSNVACGVTATNLCYVIYTSGSTGQPKGVMNQHDGVVNRLLWSATIFDQPDKEVYLQKTPYEFDVSAWELFWPLLSGAKLVYARPEGHKDGEYLIDLIQREKITTIHFVPSMLALIAEMSALSQCRSLRRVMCTGEALTTALANKVRELIPVPVYNLYGPTEAAIEVSSYCYDTAITQNYIPIGRPVSNTQLYILDSNMTPAPIGVAGELYIGGVQVARGYLNNPALTAERFIPDPFATESGYHLYKTGDQCRYLADGNIEYINRLDYQVKIRGNRIECGEIENALRQLPAIKDAVVSAIGEHEKRLAAWLVLSQEDIESRQSTQAQVTAWQQVFDDRTSADTNPIISDPLFNTQVWTSSYDGQSIPAAQMRCWADDMIEHVLARKPQRILEIGCGTGMLAFAIAPHCEHYYGTDISASSLAYMAKQQANTVDKLTNLTLKQQAADDFTGFESGSLDAVVISSVVQYFPSIDYLITVLEGCMRLVRPGGLIFLGDLRSHPLMQAFHTSVADYKGGDKHTLSQLKRDVQSRLAKEAELFIDPAFFTALVDRYTQFSAADIHLQQGASDNEMSRFRYHAVLQREGICAPELENALVIDTEGLSLDAISSRVAQSQSTHIQLKGMKNARTYNVAVFAEQLLNGEPEAALVAHDSLNDAQVDMIHPDALRALADSYGYQSKLSYAQQQGDLLFDAVLVKRKVLPTGSFIPGIAPQHEREKPWPTFANVPFYSGNHSDLLSQVKEALGETLPDYMIPSVFKILDHIPLTANGKVDRKALPQPELDRQQLSITDYVPPRTDIEKQLVAIWKKILLVEFDISVYDDFFTLGGHSLLTIKMVSEIETQLSIKLPVASIFKLQTIASIAVEIEAQKTQVLMPELVEDTRIMPTAYLDPELFKQLATFMSSWQGVRQHDDSLIVLKNAQGTKVPLFWCFQGYREFEQLAKYLGEDQPLYGFRSGHLILDYTDEELQALVSHYVSEILSLTYQGTYRIGGNCQSAVIAFEIVKQLTNRHHEVDLLIMLEWGWRGKHFQYHDKVAFLYGEQSQFNPYRRFKTPLIGFDKHYSDYSIDFIPCGHGQFFNEPNIQVLAEKITQRMGEADRLLSSHISILAYQAKLECLTDLDEISSGEPRELSIKITNVSPVTWRASFLRGCVLANHWSIGEVTYLTMLDGDSPLPSELKANASCQVSLSIKAPDEPGTYQLVCDLAEQGVTWFSEQGSKPLIKCVHVKTTA
jgi:amino acid adenylation domain-containing protein